MADLKLEIHHLDVANPPTIEWWRAILGLAKRHSGTLGFLPDSAFADRVRKGTLVAAVLGDRVVGYCLYDLPRAGHIKLVHVCVSNEARGHGAGKAMIDAAIRRNPRAIGVLAYCRDDYDNIDRFWAASGLAPRGERPGRSLSGSTLTLWWRQLGDLDLIEEATLSSGFPLVVYDTNVVSDLFASEGVYRADREATNGLLAGWLQAAIIPAVSPHVDVELNRIADRDERRAQRERSSGLLRLRSELADDGGALETLIDLVGRERVNADSSLRDDLRHVADAKAAGAAFFVTNDSNLLDAAQALHSHTDLRIVRPHRLVTEMLDQLGRPTFKSRLIESVELTWEPASSHDLDDLVDAFLSHERNERATDLRRALRTAISTAPTTTRVLVTPEAKLWALIAQQQTDDAVEVKLLRTGRGEAVGTVAWQLARHLRVIARDSGLTAVEVVDDNVTTAVAQALSTDGYVGSPPCATLIDGAMTGEQLAATRPDIRLETPLDVRAAERRFWPLTLLERRIPTYITPIQPRYAEQLFGIDRGYLWHDRKRALGLSREHVYYSGSARALPPANARILWYVTSDPTGTFRQVMARSRSLGCTRMSPEEAHAINAEVGVFKKRDVDGAADRSGLVTVVRFEDTELLTPVGGDRLDELLRAHGVKHPILSFREVDPGLFDAIEKHQRGEAS